MSPAITLRPATKDDIASIVRIGEAAFSAESDPIIPKLFPLRLQPTGKREPDYQRAWREARARAALEDSNNVYMLAEDDGQVAGLIQWSVPSKNGSDGAPPLKLPDTIDMELVQHIRTVVTGAAMDLFGERGSKDAWCKCAEDGR